MVRSINHAHMAGDLLRKPDEFSGPAVLDREPIVLPEQRKKVVREIKRRMR